MHLLLDVQAEKLPFILELVQQLDGVNIVRMENNELPQIAQQHRSPTLPETSPSPDNLGDQMDDLQNELNDLFG